VNFNSAYGLPEDRFYDFSRAIMRFEDKLTIWYNEDYDPYAKNPMKINIGFSFYVESYDPSTLKELKVVARNTHQGDVVISHVLYNGHEYDEYSAAYGYEDYDSALYKFSGMADSVMPLGDVADLDRCLEKSADYIEGVYKKVSKVFHVVNIYNVM
jgi:hypothetical protein